MSNIDIFKAIRENDLDSVARYIKEGGDLNVRDDRGHTALMEATFRGMYKYIKLLESGADVNLKDNYADKIFKKLNKIFKNHFNNNNRGEK
ncbi:MAG: ankyrin repeat domain-containing protein [Sphaerospermopsis sp.]|nr:ankyrin repeat domain-containing protein [Sphaerospermopsis sp.]